MPVNRKSDAEKVVIEIVMDLIQDWGLDLEDTVTGKTLLVKDLDFASVDIIQLCVAIEEHFKRKFGFQDLLMKDGSYVSDLSVGRVASFLVDKGI
ncbi:MAG: acyl carrier protein [Deltaproteobacteria bacterium]|nr:acyl carrier protein [Deltaproteobacteria bacterium]